jgi:hypothetical protein
MNDYNSNTLQVHWQSFFIKDNYNCAENFCVSVNWRKHQTGILKCSKSKNINRERLEIQSMRSPHEIKRVIETRLRCYISRDKTGIRRELLRLFVRVKSMTIAELVAELQKNFSVTFHKIASMVGIIASRIGILRVTKSPDGVSLYELKDKYVDVVVRIVGVS